MSKLLDASEKITPIVRAMWDSSGIRPQDLLPDESLADEPIDCFGLTRCKKRYVKMALREIPKEEGERLMNRWDGNGSPTPDSFE